MHFKKRIIFLSVLSTFSLKSGIDGDMLVETPQGKSKLATLKVGSELVCYNGKKKTIDTIKSKEGIEVDKYLQVKTWGGEEINTLPDQKVYVTHYNDYDPETESVIKKSVNKWIKVKDLLPGHCILSNKVIYDFFGEGSQSNEVLTIDKKYGRKILNYIVLKNIHNYMADENGMVLHNGPLLGLVGYWTTKILCYGAATAGVVGTVVYAPTVAVSAGAKVTALATSLGASTTTATSVGGIVSGSITGTANVIASAPTIGVKGAFVLGTVTNATPVVATTVTATVTGTATATTLGTAALTATPGSASIATAVANAGWFGCLVAKVESISVTVGAFLATLPTP